MWAAPQDTNNSNITYVKIEPIVDDTPVENLDNHRQSRIENLPLIIPGNITQEAKKDAELNQTESRNNIQPRTSDNRSRESSRENNSREKSRKFQRKYTFAKRTTSTDNNRQSLSVNKIQSLNLTQTNQSDTKTIENNNNKREANSSVSALNTNSSTADRIQVEPKAVTELKASDISEELHVVKEDSANEKSEIDPTAVDLDNDNIAADTNKFEKVLEVTTTRYETNDPGTAELTTLKLEPLSVSKTTVKLENITKPNFTKLGYYKKSSSTLSNSIQRPVKKRFRSRCRCEKIWNCPKLQITVPRCPDEYFLCCF